MSVSEKLEKYGIDGVTTEELLSSLLNEKQASNIDLVSPDQSKGKIAKKKAKLLVALAAKIKTTPLEKGDKFSSSLQVYNALRGKVMLKERECFWAVLLNTRLKVIKLIQLVEGSLFSCQLHPRDVFRAIFLNNATAVILVHNHPSGNPTPSREDKAFTDNMVKCSEIMDIRLLDHVVVCADSYFSFADNGLM